jgi:hypothetical protein
VTTKNWHNRRKKYWKNTSASMRSTRPGKKNIKRMEANAGQKLTEVLRNYLLSNLSFDAMKTLHYLLQRRCQSHAKLLRPQLLRHQLLRHQLLHHHFTKLLRHQLLRHQLAKLLRPQLLRYQLLRHQLLHYHFTKLLRHQPLRHQLLLLTTTAYCRALLFYPNQTIQALR